MDQSNNPSRSSYMSVIQTLLCEQNVQTCPNDRRKFENILVRLDLDGEVVRKIPIQKTSKAEEELAPLDITECQVLAVTSLIK